MMLGMPSRPMLANHSTMIGPKKLPTRAVPCFCTANRIRMITTVMGTTNSVSAGVATSRPLTADSTEIAGVITLSP